MNHAARARNEITVEPAPIESVTAEIIGRTASKVRVRLRGAEPFAIAVGSVLVVESDFETVGATVIGIRDARVVELELRADIEARIKVIKLRRSTIGAGQDDGGQQ